MFNIIWISLLFQTLSLAGSTSETPQLSESLRKSLERPEKEIIDEYLEIHRQFSSSVCTPGTEQRFFDLDHNLRGFGFYVPTLLNEKLDSDTVNRFTPEVESKKEWIAKQIEFLEKMNNEQLNKLRNELDTLEQQVQELVEFKKSAYMGSTLSIREQAKIKSRYKLIEFRQKWQAFLNQIPFMVSYQFPVDHFDLRKTNDLYRAQDGEEARKKANEVYFYRQIVQDGAQNPDRTRNDAFLRSVLDTITLRLAREQNQQLLSEDLRYDLNFALSGLRRQLSSQKSHLLKRLGEWKERTQAGVEFYKSLQDGDKKIDDEHQTGDQVASSLARARHTLKDFSLKKQAEVYHFWRQQSELMRALFAIEVILYNEVADLDGREALERRDIAQVVLNRINTPRYAILEESDSILSYLDKEAEKLNSYPWLNALFKEGEFSFTYYFIRSNVRIFCPETTRRGRFLLRENLSVAIDRLNNPNFDFDALRYFSRHSMQGRIDMSEIWSEYSEIAERAGPIIKNDGQLKKAFESDDFEFHYRFSDEQGESFDVIQINGTQYARARESGSFYTYRNPHFFRYYRYDS